MMVHKDLNKQYY